MAVVAKRWISINSNMWHRYLTDFAIRCFQAINDKDSSWCGEKDTYVIDVWLRLLPERRTHRRFAMLHVLAYYRSDLLSQLVTLFRPLGIMRDYVCREEYKLFMRKVRDAGQLSQAETDGNPVVSLNPGSQSDPSTSANRLDAYFFCEVILEHVNNQLRKAVKELDAKEASQQLLFWYTAVQLVVSETAGLGDCYSVWMRFSDKRSNRIHFVPRSVTTLNGILVLLVLSYFLSVIIMLWIWWVSIVWTFLCSCRFDFVLDHWLTFPCEFYIWLSCLTVRAYCNGERSSCSHSQLPTWCINGYPFRTE